ncbi:DUF3667 domain-containing protein [Alteraurantiacibacter aestuarii]|uniref:DUF3667 domain-containing protein n=1 Tax=Alteraurantiacibacter aestuarii TaxID=650004 RepID=A0A844ZU41_9SPHN|nr:DUF3667 domain-containing protein [Alteraurantiacibacter aestuarii]MXO89079.1 DUF3667 domain-containing protein [Alteraurantiacibacter aestuarii]
MSDILDGIGTAAEGGLFARALEPHSGAQGKHPHQPDNCLNCDTPLIGAYCHACGQHGHVHRTIGAFWHDLMHGALHLDGKMWRTLPLLVLRPGRLTRRYIEGARARFVSPMALFLFSVFLMFAVFQMLGITAPTDLQTNNPVQRGIETGMVEAEAAQNAAQTELDRLSATDPGRAAAETRLSEASEALAAMRLVRSYTISENLGANMSIKPTGVAFIDDGIGKKWRENPSLMLYKLQANSYKFSWLLIPISIPFVWLLFAWKRRFKGYDHAIFVTYSLSFMTLFFVVLSVLGWLGVGGGWLFTAFATLAPLHIYKQLRGAYGLSRFSAIWRLVALLLLIFLIVLLFLQALLLLGAF